MTTSKTIQLRQIGRSRIKVLFTNPEDVKHREASCINKVMYSSPEFAQEVIDKRKVKLYVYHCKFCQAYHLSKRK